MLKSSCGLICSNLSSHLCIEGPCLIHSMNGDLLRTLEGPERCLRPRLIQSSAEGHCVIYYDKGQFCLFSVNGKLLRHMEVEDGVKVRTRSHTCVCTASAYKVLSLIKSSVLVLDASEVKVAVPRDKLTASHLFFPFHPHYTRGKASFDPELCCQVKLRWRRWRKTFQRSGQLWTPTPLTTLQRGTTHSPFPTFPPSWLG